jgi:hypothetical protein
MSSSSSIEKIKAQVIIGLSEWLEQEGGSVSELTRAFTDIMHDHEKLTKSHKPVDILGLSAAQKTIIKNYMRNLSCAKTIVVRNLTVEHLKNTLWSKWGSREFPHRKVFMLDLGVGSAVQHVKLLCPTGLDFKTKLDNEHLLRANIPYFTGVEISAERALCHNDWIEFDSTGENMEMQLSPDAEKLKMDLTTAYLPILEPDLACFNIDREMYTENKVASKTNNISELIYLKLKTSNSAPFSEEFLRVRDCKLKSEMILSQLREFL